MESAPAPPSDTLSSNKHFEIFVSPSLTDTAAPMGPPSMSAKTLMRAMEQPSIATIAALACTAQPLTSPHLWSRKSVSRRVKDGTELSTDSSGAEGPSPPLPPKNLQAANATAPRRRDTPGEEGEGRPSKRQPTKFALGGGG